MGATALPADRRWWRR